MNENPLTHWHWQPPVHWQAIETLDMHTGGEPLRILTKGIPTLKGDTILAMRRYFRDHYDHLRTGLMWEPRGHADMYGAIITPPVTNGADFGTFFLHNEGYSTMCGHAIIALTKMALDTQLIKKDTQNPTLTLDAPPGCIQAQALREHGVVTSVTFTNVPSFTLLQDEYVDVPGLGQVRFDVAYGGAFYAFVEAEDVGLSLEASHYNQLIDAGRKIKHAVAQNFAICHPFEEDLSFLYGTIFTGKAHNPAHHSRNVCIFADGEVDRSATGSGVSARAALHAARGDWQTGKTYTIESILGTTMQVSIQELTTFGPHAAVRPNVTGTASITGRQTFYFDPEDPLCQGFIFR